MNKRVRKLTGTLMLFTLIGALVMTNSVDTVRAQTNEAHVSAVADVGSAHCQRLGPGEMSLLSGSGWADWALRLIDVGCVSGSAAAVLKMTSPFVGAFCAGWAIGRYIGG